MSSGEKFLPRKKNEPYQKLVINRMQIVDAVAAWLHAGRLVEDSHEISNIQFEELFGESTIELVPIKVFTNKERPRKESG